MTADGITPDLVATRLRDLASVAESAAMELPTQVAEAARLVRDTLSAGGTLFFCGNGGSAADAQHIAIATVGRVDVLVSWNFKHIVNLQRIHGYNSVNLRRGYPMIEIRTPREVLSDE